MKQLCNARSNQDRSKGLGASNQLDPSNSETSLCKALRSCLVCPLVLTQVHYSGGALENIAGPLVTIGIKILLITFSIFVAETLQDQEHVRAAIGNRTGSCTSKPVSFLGAAQAVGK